MLVLVESVTGAFEEAIAIRDQIDARYRRLHELDEVILWDHLHRGDFAEAHRFAERRGLLRRATIAKRLRLSLERPFETSLDGVADVPFTDDPLTPFMPGFAAQLNGRPTVARLDTGGTYVHLSSEMALAHGIETVVAEREFAALRWHTVRYGVGDLEIGPIHLANVPVVVHDGALPAAAIGAAFGVELGPIIGTNVLERFLDDDRRARPATAPVAAPGCQGARAAHLASVTGPHEAPFAVWEGHLMIARGRVGVTNANFFVDSGLVMYNDEQGQAAMLASAPVLAGWGVPDPGDGRFAELPGSVSIGTASQGGMTAYTVPDRTWRDFGDWGGIRVDALISWGFLRNFVWTIDFDRRRYLFGEAVAEPT